MLYVNSLSLPWEIRNMLFTLVADCWGSLSHSYHITVFNRKNILGAIDWFLVFKHYWSQGAKTAVNHCNQIDLALFVNCCWLTNKLPFQSWICLFVFQWLINMTCTTELQVNGTGLYVAGQLVAKKAKGRMENKGDRGSFHTRKYCH